VRNGAAVTEGSAGFSPAPTGQDDEENGGKHQPHDDEAHAVKYSYSGFHGERQTFTGPPCSTLQHPRQAGGAVWPVELKLTGAGPVCLLCFLCCVCVVCVCVAMFCLAACYIAMLLTQWGEIDGNNVDKGLVSRYLYAAHAENRRGWRTEPLLGPGVVLIRRACPLSHGIRTS
jgi:hypothetical protein